MSPLSTAYCKTWTQAYYYKTERRGDWGADAGFMGMVDFPSLDFIPEMLELCPEAEVVRKSDPPGPLSPLPSHLRLPCFADDEGGSTAGPIPFFHPSHERTNERTEKELLVKYND